METKNELHTALRKAEAEKNQMQGQVERLQREGKKLETERDNLLLRGKNSDKTHKESM